MNKNQIKEYLLSNCNFKAFEFQPKLIWKLYSKASSINLLEPTEYELDDALNVYFRDGFKTIVIYI